MMASERGFDVQSCVFDRRGSGLTRSRDRARAYLVECTDIERHVVGRRGHGRREAQHKQEGEHVDKLDTFV